MKEYNEILDRFYEPEECLFFENALQSNAYIFRGNAKLQALLNSKAHPGRFIFVFLKSDHERLKQAWNEHRL